MQRVLGPGKQASRSTLSQSRQLVGLPWIVEYDGEPRLCFAPGGRQRVYGSFCLGIPSHSNLVGTPNDLAAASPRNVMYSPR